MSDASPVFISVDWGTSSFRAYLADAAGRALDEIPSGTGALALKAGEHEPYLTARIGHWPRLPVVASGMVGARQGWLEAPYAPCPAGAEEIARALVVAPAPALGGVRILPGVSVFAPDGAPDVMRGEETQILGALAASGREDGLFVLPGTHSKWARVEGGRITGFATYMTGEVFAVMKDHSVLGRMMAPAEAGEGFARGVDTAAGLDHPGDLLHALFRARTFGLFDQLPPHQLPEYLSGLLIGAEIIAGARGMTAAVAIGSQALVARYQAAGERLGVAFSAAPANCATLGQLAILRRLGI